MSTRRKVLEVLGLLYVWLATSGSSCSTTATPPAPDPHLNAMVTCHAIVDYCTRGEDVMGNCMGYGPDTTFLPDPFPYDVCVDDRSTPAQQAQFCMNAAGQNCSPFTVHNGMAGCRVISSSVASFQTNVCGTTPPGPGGGNRPSPGAGVPDDPTAKYWLLSYQFTLTSPPTQIRKIPISAPFGTPAAVDARGFLYTITKSPNTIIGYDLGTPTPTFGLPPATLTYPPNAFQTIGWELATVSVTASVGDSVGMQLYVARPSQANATPQVPKTVGTTVAVDTVAMSGISQESAGVTVSPNAAVYVNFSNVTTTSGNSSPLPGTAVDVTLGGLLQTFWATSLGTGSVGGYLGHFDAITATALNHCDLPSEPIALGGGDSAEYQITSDQPVAPAPGDIAVLLKTATGGEIRLFGQGGVLSNCSQFVSIPVNADPKVMKLITIDAKQYAWVGSQSSTNGLVQLFGFVERTSIAGFDINLGALEPLGVIAATPDPPNQPNSSDYWNGSTTAIVHVLVKAP